MRAAFPSSFLTLKFSFIPLLHRLSFHYYSFARRKEALVFNIQAGP
jgi:hypothetical protein